MAKIFITGSSDGLGQLAAKSLVSQGHQVVLHGRNETRARQAIDNVPGAEDALIGDLSDTEETKKLAGDVNALGAFDAIIHNAGVYQASSETKFNVNTLAPYNLTCLINKPKRLIYLTSGLHSSGNINDLDSIFEKRGVSYSDSKLHNLILTLAVARKWPDVYANAVNPGWVPTKMGGRGAPDNLEKGYRTQAWLAVSNDDQAMVSGRYFYHQKQRDYLPAAGDPDVQEKFLSLCEQVSGIHFPDK